MLTFIESSPTTSRLTIFLLCLIIFALLEWRFPKRQLTVNKSKRWFSNLLLVQFNSLALRLFFPITLAGWALYCQDANIGLFAILPLSNSVETLFSIIFLDFVIWLQHRIFHAVPIFWRLHMVHHADQNLDVSSAARFHTLEMLLSMLIKMVVVALLGAPVIAVILFEIILSSLAMFNHANINLAKSIDKIVRLFVVTPDMHRIHHSVKAEENNSNFGFCLSIWDWLFNTYCHKPQLGQINMQIGLKFIRDENEASHFISMLKMPFRKLKK